MRKLAKIAAPALAAIAALGAVLPAQAATRHGDGYGYGSSHGSGHGYGYGRDRGDYRQIAYFRGQINDLTRMIERRDHRDRLSEREARALRGDLYNLRIALDRFSRNGLSRGEASQLQNHIANLRSRIARESRDHDRRPW